MSLTASLLGSCAAYFGSDGPATFKGRVGASMPSDSLIYLIKK